MKEKIDFVINFYQDLFLLIENLFYHFSFLLDNFIVKGTLFISFFVDCKEFPNIVFIPNSLVDGMKIKISKNLKAIMIGNYHLFVKYPNILKFCDIFFV